MLKSHYYEQYVEAGCDEAGRGCLAGSVYAAAVICLATTVMMSSTTLKSSPPISAISCERLSSATRWHGLWVS